jgi:hypothetical protein
MKFVEAIHLALQQSTTVITAVGSSQKIFQSFASPTTSVPFIVVGSQSDAALNPTIKGTGDTVRLATLIVDCVSSSLLQATNIADHVRVDLYNSAGSLATASNSPMVIQNIRIDNSNMAYDMGSEGTEYGVFVCSVTVKIWYVASTPAPITLVTNPTPPAL